MLSAVLRSVQSLADKVNELPDSPRSASEAKGRARQLTATVLPMLHGMQEAVAAFARSAVVQLDELAEEISKGSTTSVIIQAKLTAIGTRCAEQRDMLDRVVEELNRSRSGFATDYGNLINQQVELQARIAGLAAQRNRWAAESDQLRTRNITTTIIGIFIPLVKLADELASLIQYRKSTEAALADASSALAETMHEGTLLDMAVTQISTLLGLVDQLVGGVQHLDNAMNLVKSQLDNEDRMAGAVTPATAGLFTRALKNSFGQLEAEAA